MKQAVVTPVRVLVLALVGIVLLGGGMVLADGGGEDDEHPAFSTGATITLEVPQEMAVGKEASLLAALSGSGPRAGAEVLFLATLTFAGTRGEVVLGRAFTDTQGIARFTFVPRTQGEVNIIARFVGDGQMGPVEVSRRITVQPGPALYRETVGVRVPGIGVWLLLAVLGAVWSTYLTVAVILGAIARRGRAPHAEPTWVRRPAPFTAASRGAGNG
ncbi:MAG: hypothetical protein ACK4K2_04225 [Dehalococcoidia bacterium]